MATDAIFHPWVAEIALSVRNSATRALRRWPQTLFLACAWGALLALAAVAVSRVDGDRIGLMLGSLAQHPLPVVLALAALVAGTTRAATQATRRVLTQGWWGAIPVPATATHRTLLLVGALVGAVHALALTGLLGAVAWISDRPEHWFAPAASAIFGGVAAGVAIGLYAARKPPRDHATARRRGRGAPLFGVALLERGALTHAPRWQRVEALRRWRAGGGLWPFILLGLVIPANESPGSAAGLILFGLAAIWGGIALRACLGVIARLSAVLAALPLRARDFISATARFPVVVVLATSFWGVSGLALQQAGPAFLLGFPALFAALVLHQLALAWRYRDDPRRARLRFAAELALLAGLALSLLPLVFLGYGALVVRHIQQAIRKR